ncbi:MAG: universal stress protein, partial [Synechococcaceae cyanobacterium SM2_3_60]|nr:universal stress protein [Synechococcaceae cyanobacterium SM2_3_60]
GNVVNPAPAAATQTEPVGWGQRVLVPVANPNTEQSLLNLALLLTQSAQGTLLPLNVLRDRGQGIPAAEQVRQNQLLSVAESLAHAAVTKVERIARVDNSIEQGIVHAVYEHQPSLVVVGWKGYSSYTENLFGGIIDRVLQRAGVPILVTRLMQPLEATQRILFAVPEGVAHTPRVIAALDLAHTLATELKAPLQILLSETRQLTPINFGLPNGESVSCLRRPGSLVNEVVKAYQPGDLLVLLPGIRTTPLGRPTMGNAPETVARIKTEASIAVLYLPPAYYGFGELVTDPDEATTEILEPEASE